MKQKECCQKLIALLNNASEKGNTTITFDYMELPVFLSGLNGQQRHELGTASDNTRSRTKAGSGTTTIMVYLLELKVTRRPPWRPHQEGSWCCLRQWRIMSEYAMLHLLFDCLAQLYLTAISPCVQELGLQVVLLCALRPFLATFHGADHAWV